MTDKEIFLKIGAQITRFRHLGEINTKELADRCGLKEQFIKSLEAGNIDPSMPVLINIIKNLTVSMSVFFADIEF